MSPRASTGHRGPARPVVGQLPGVTETTVLDICVIVSEAASTQKRAGEDNARQETAMKVIRVLSVAPMLLCSLSVFAQGNWTATTTTGAPSGT